MKTGAACESGLDQIGQLSIPRPLPIHRSRQFRAFQFRTFMSDSLRQALGLSTHSQLILFTDCITKVQKGNAVDLLC
jgi:hypothetical protein